MPGIDRVDEKSVWPCSKGNILYAKRYIPSLIPEILSGFLNL